MSSRYTRNRQEGSGMIRLSCIFFLFCILILYVFRFFFSYFKPSGSNQHFFKVSICRGSVSVTSLCRQQRHILDVLAVAFFTFESPYGVCSDSCIRPRLIQRTRSRSSSECYRVCAFSVVAFVPFSPMLTQVHVAYQVYWDTAVEVFPCTSMTMQISVIHQQINNMENSAISNKTTPFWCVLRNLKNASAVSVSVRLIHTSQSFPLTPNTLVRTS